MPDSKQCSNDYSFSKQIVSGIAVVVLAGLILWLCNSVSSHETRITVNENNMQNTASDILEIKIMLKDISKELREGLN